MPPIELEARYEDAVLWPAVTAPPLFDPYGERIVSDTPVPIRVQWVNKRSQVISPQGIPIAIDATLVVDRRIEVGSKVWRGSLADWTGTGSGTDVDPDSNVHDVVFADEQRDVKGRMVRRTVGVTLHRRGLPQQG